MKTLSKVTSSDVQLNVDGEIFQNIFNIFDSTVAFRNADGRMWACLQEHTSFTQSKPWLKEQNDILHIKWTTKCSEKTCIEKRVHNKHRIPYMNNLQQFPKKPRKCYNMLATVSSEKSTISKYSNEY